MNVPSLIDWMRMDNFNEGHLSSNPWGGGEIWIQILILGHLFPEKAFHIHKSFLQQHPRTVMGFDMLCVSDRNFLWLLGEKTRRILIRERGFVFFFFTFPLWKEESCYSSEAKQGGTIHSSQEKVNCFWCSRLVRIKRNTFKKGITVHSRSGLWP